MSQLTTLSRKSFMHLTAGRGLMQHYKHILLDETLQPHLVLLHSAYRNHQSFSPFLKAYENTYLHDFETIEPDAGFGQVWMVDLRGHGMSLQQRKSMNYKIRTHAEDIDAFLVAGKIKAEPHVFVANGIGGLAALDYWLERPDFGNGGVIIDAQPGMKINPFPKVLGRTFKKFDQWVSFMREEYLPHIPKDVVGDLVKKNTYMRRRDNMYAWMIDPNFVEPEHDDFSEGLWRRLKNAKPGPKTEIVFVRGSNSPYTQYDKMKQLVDMMNESQSREWVKLVEIKGAGHYVHEDNPREVAEILNKQIVPGIRAQYGEAGYRDLALAAKAQVGAPHAQQQPFIPGRGRSRIGEAMRSGQAPQPAAGSTAGQQRPRLFQGASNTQRS